MRRRRFVAAAALAPLALGMRNATAAARAFDVERGRELVFPRDFGSHPGYSIEWWYATGQLDAANAPLGFQITFFRARHATRSEGRFAPREILFAHAAIADTRERRLLHAEVAARAGFPDAYARDDDTALRIHRWRMARASDGTYRVSVPAASAAQPFAFDLALAPTEPLLLHGDRGFSQKGPSPTQASYYYSEPQLAVDGTVTLHGAALRVRGRAWLDHEWSQSYLDRRASGWDWTGVNLDDGAALMAFRIRDRDDASRTLWAAATLRDAQGRVRTFGRDDVAFEPTRRWTSPRTNATYPVACALRVGDARFDLEPLFDDQELDSRRATGFVYWEGAVVMRRGGARAGAGYLELTGYAQPLRLER